MEDQLLKFVDLALSNFNNDKEIFEFDVPNDVEINRLFSLSGHVLTNYRRVMDSFAVRHVFKNHGNPKMESLRGQIAVLPEDFTLISLVLIQYDSFTVEKYRIGNIMFRYTMETEEFRLIYAEEVRAGRRELAVQTLYKQKIRKP